MTDEQFDRLLVVLNRLAGAIEEHDKPLHYRLRRAVDKLVSGTAARVAECSAPDAEDIHPSPFYAGKKSRG